MGNEISIMDAISITVASMTIVFLILFLISLVLTSFKFIFKEKPVSTVETKEVSNTIVVEEDDEEERIVVALAASIMAGDGKLNPNLHVKRIERIK